MITLGDHLRWVRLTRSLSQIQVAKMLKVETDTLTGWELNRHTPPARLAKKIIQFIGYFPFSTDGLTLGKKLYYARILKGLSQEAAANLLGCDESNLRMIELDQRKPMRQIFSKIDQFVSCLEEPVTG